jgi:hypothetical protein
MKKIRIAFAAMAMAGMLAACGSSDDGSGSDDGVASLGSTTTSPDGQEQTTETSVDPQEAMLAYTECMRDEGIDMPDPVMSEDGSGGGMVITRDASDEGGGQGPAFDPDSEEFQAAEEKCSPIMDEAIGSIEIDPEQQAEMREQMLEYAQCMRDQGIDFPDPEFSDNGRVTMGLGQEGEPPTDAEMEAMDAANEVCAKDGGPMAMGAAPAAAED